MIKVTRFNEDVVIVNAELIEMIEARPDTIITLTTGKKLLVAEGVADVIRKVIEYRQVIRPILRTNVPLDGMGDYPLDGEEEEEYMDFEDAVDVLENGDG